MLKNRPTVGFIGQGYVGKNYADDLEERGYETVRYSLEEQYRHNKDRIRDCDIVFLGLPTPTSPEGFDASIIRNALALIGTGKIALIKSTMIPGTTATLQKQYPEIIVLYSPEFLSETTAAYDAAHPFSNIVGMPEASERYRKAAEAVHAILPKAPFSLTCTSTEAELVKYSHNSSGYVQIMLFNMLYDLARRNGCDWSVIHRAIVADPMICNRYAQPIHKSGRGAGGHCFIKDFASLSQFYEKEVGDKHGVSLFKALEEKNIQLLISSGKDVDLLAGVYGKKILDAAKGVRVEELRPTPGRELDLLICTQAVDKGDPILGFFHQWVAEFGRHARNVYAICLQRGPRSLPPNVSEFSLGKETAHGPRYIKRVLYTARFLSYVWKLRKAYDTVLVHINAEYVLLAGLLWRIWGKRIGFLTNDTRPSIRTRLAARLAHVVFYSDHDAYVARFSNSVQVPVGVETEVFLSTARKTKENSLLFLGRITRAKNIDTIIKAMNRLTQSKIAAHLDIYGATVLREDEEYYRKIKLQSSELERKGVITFCGSILHDRTPIEYSSHEIFVHAGSASGFNKAMYEAMAAGCLIVTLEKSVRDVINPKLFVQENSDEALARAIQAALSLTKDEKEAERAKLRAFVEREHALSTIAPNMFEALYPRTLPAQAAENKS